MRHNLKMWLLKIVHNLGDSLTSEPMVDESTTVMSEQFQTKDMPIWDVYADVVLDEVGNNEEATNNGEDVQNTEAIVELFPLVPVQRHTKSVFGFVY